MATKKDVRKIQNYRTYILQVLKRYWPEMGISNVAIEIMNSFVLDIIERITVEASNLLTNLPRITLTAHDIQCAVSLCLNGQVLYIYISTHNDHI